MKKTIVLVVLAIVLCAPDPSAIAQNVSVPRYEFAIVKWDGPDRLYYNLPDKFELVYLTKSGVTIPKDAQAEEFCLTYAANKMAKDGWETLTLDSRRILLRRALK